jgi:predicted glycosyltransferase
MNSARGVDFVRIPGVVKIETGEYDSANLRMNVEHTLEMRTRIIRDTADIFRPDLFIVDKEPLGLRGEVGPALRLLKERGTPLVLGLRDVMDDPAQLAKEWERKNVVPALRDLYDEIWVYGLPQVNKPLTGHRRPSLGPSQDGLHGLSEARTAASWRRAARNGGDRRSLHPGDARRWRRRCRAGRLGAGCLRDRPQHSYGAVIVFGPFMPATAREAFKERAARFPNIRTLTFTNNLGALMKSAAGVVAMGGYNTFCEILSFDKRAIIVPRTHPRLEQFIRARAARNIGLIEMLDPNRGYDPQAMATALRHLPQQGVPSDVVVPGLLDGLGSVWRLVSKQLSNPHRGPASLGVAEQPGAHAASELASEDLALLPERHRS